MLAPDVHEHFSRPVLVPRVNELELILYFRADFRVSGREASLTDAVAIVTMARGTAGQAAADGKDYMVFGFNLQPRGDDPRLVENRLYFDDSKNPTHIEIQVVTRNADGSAREKQVEKIDWPG